MRWLECRHNRMLFSRPCSHDTIMPVTAIANSPRSEHYTETEACVRLLTCFNSAPVRVHQWRQQLYINAVYYIPDLLRKLVVRDTQQSVSLATQVSWLWRRHKFRQSRWRYACGLTTENYVPCRQTKIKALITIGAWQYLCRATRLEAKGYPVDSLE